MLKFKAGLIVLTVLSIAAPGAVVAQSGESSDVILARMKRVCHKEREAAIALIQSGFGDRAYSERLADMPLQRIGDIRTAESARRLEQSARADAQQYPMLAAQTLYPACVYAARGRELASAGSAPSRPASTATAPAPRPVPQQPTPPPQQSYQAPASSSSYSQRASGSPSRAPSSSGGTSRYIDEDTGQDCVRQQGAQTVKTEGYYHTYTLTLVNTCDRNFTISLRQEPEGKPVVERGGVIYKRKPDGTPTTAVFSCIEARKAENYKLSTCTGGIVEWGYK
jgi:hypothetical protein